MSALVIIPYAIVFLAYITFVILILIGGIYLSNIVFNESSANLEFVGIDTTDKRNICRMVIVLFWIVFIPLCILPILLAMKK